MSVYISSAVVGDNIVGARSFGFAVSTSAMANGLAVVAGCYSVATTADCWVSVRGTNTAIAAAPGTTQPAAGSENGALWCPAGVPQPLTFPADGYYVSAISPSGGSSGVVYLSGPIRSTPGVE